MLFDLICIQKFWKTDSVQVKHYSLKHSDFSHSKIINNATNICQFASIHIHIYTPPRYYLFFCLLQQHGDFLYKSTFRRFFFFFFFKRKQPLKGVALQNRCSNSLWGSGAQELQCTCSPPIYTASQEEISWMLLFRNSQGKMLFSSSNLMWKPWLQPCSCAVSVLKSSFVTMPPESQAEKGMGWSYLPRIWSHMISFGLSAVLRQWFAF